MELEGVPASEQKRLVRRGYDMVSRAYRADDYEYEGSGYQRILDLVLPELRDSDRVLELGCGCGVPVTKALAARCGVIGVDLSRVQLGRARRLVPGVDLLEADMCRLQFREESLNGITAFYSFIHVPLEEQPALLRRLRGWLRPGGFLLATVGYQRWIGSEEDWCGVPGATMYWSHEDRETNRRWFEEAGFELEREEFMPEGGGGATVLLARKPGRQRQC
jgi:SAM-dependent methyltransferase